jgi:hypothetical protein
VARGRHPAGSSGRGATALQIGVGGGGVVACNDLAALPPLPNRAGKGQRVFGCPQDREPSASRRSWSWDSGAGLCPVHPAGRQSRLREEEVTPHIVRVSGPQLDPTRHVRGYGLARIDHSIPRGPDGCPWIVLGATPSPTKAGVTNRAVRLTCGGRTRLILAAAEDQLVRGRDDKVIVPGRDGRVFAPDAATILTEFGPEIRRKWRESGISPGPPTEGLAGRSSFSLHNLWRFWEEGKSSREGG